MAIPGDLVESVKKGECVLFLGARGSAPSPEGSRFSYKHAPPSAKELSEQLAQLGNYPPDEDQTNLQRVSLHFQYRDHGSRESLVKTVKKLVADQGVEPSPALNMLAALPFRSIITTNYDHFFDNALGRVKSSTGGFKDPLTRIYDPTIKTSPENVPLYPTEENPILFKLHGDFDRPESIVITEEDYITFIQRMSSQHLHPIPENLRAQMNSLPILFVGYSLKDYNFRLLFRTLRWNVDEANFPLSFSVDPHPDNLIVAVWERGQKKIVSFIEEDLWDFVPELYKDCKGVEFQP